MPERCLHCNWPMRAGSFGYCHQCGIQELLDACWPAMLMILGTLGTVAGILHFLI